VKFYLDGYFVKESRKWRRENAGQRTEEALPDFTANLSNWSSENSIIYGHYRTNDPLNVLAKLITLNQPKRTIALDIYFH